MTFIVTERGAPFTAQGLGSFFKKQCRLAGLPHCSIHGLRKAAVTRLVNAGCSNEQIKEPLERMAHAARGLGLVPKGYHFAWLFDYPVVPFGPEFLPHLVDRFPDPHYPPKRTMRS